MMKEFGFVRVAAATPSVLVADCDYNTSEIIKLIKEAEAKHSGVIVFPEASITAYTCADLFHQQTLLKGAITSLEYILKETISLNIIAIVGMPLEVSNQLYNVGVVISKGQILGVVPKTFMPSYGEFYDTRWFTSSTELKETTITLCKQEVAIGSNIIFQTPNYKFAIEICEDLWTPIPPSSRHALYGADIIFNLSASPETVGKNQYRKSLIMQQSARCIAGYVYASAGNGESTTDLVFSGTSLIAENGSLLAENERYSFQSNVVTADIDVNRLRNDRLRNSSFTTTHNPSVEYKTVYINTKDDKKENINLDRDINPTPFIPSDKYLSDSCSEIFSIQVGGLAKRLLHINCKSAVIGISGGLDSTLALLALVRTFDKLEIPRENILGITMPGFGTTGRTYNNAVELMKSLRISMKEISIVPAVNQHFKDIEHDPELHDITYENSQARERTQILMDYANKLNGIVIGTGNLSELALGWCTYNGDHMSMYAINSGIPKTLVRVLVKWVSDNHLDKQSSKILDDVLDTPFSPELLPADSKGEIAQVTEDNVGPYILHDFFLYNMLRFGFEPRKIYFLAQHAFKNEFSDAIILKWLRTFYWRFFSQQFKRSCIPDGPKVGSINLSPRGDWRMPSDAKASLWLKQLDAMQ